MLNIEIFEGSPIHQIVEGVFLNIYRMQSSFEKPCLEFSLRINYLLEMLLPMKEMWEYKYDAETKMFILDVRKDEKALEKMESIMSTLYR